MFDTRILGIPNGNGRALVHGPLPMQWENFEQLDFREVDIGAPVLTYVAILSEHEARERNKRYRIFMQQQLDEGVAKHGSDYYLLHMPRTALAHADRVDELLTKITQNGYFASWVIIERCTID